MQLEIEGIGKVNDVIKRYITILDNDGSMSLSIGIGDLTLSVQIICKVLRKIRCTF
jgi:hypothetical protein